MSMTREEAIKALRIEGIEIGGKANRLAEFMVALDVAQKALRPVSREQVIHCKDCRYWQDNNGGYPHPECRWATDETPDADDYCSFAERLEESKNGRTMETC